MRNLLIVAVLAAGAFGVYRAFEAYSGGAAEKAAHEVSGGQLQEAQRRLEGTAEKIGRVNASIVQDAVNRFRADKDRNPASLQELVEGGYLDSVPAGVTYDSATGTVGGG